MSNLILGVVLFAGCSLSRDGGQSPATPSESKDLISREQAMHIAISVNAADYDRGEQIRVELTNGQYIVTFPVKKPALQPGTRWCGPDYAAKIWIDAKTGKVLKHMFGS